MKNFKIIIPILLITLSLSSCKLWLGGYTIKKHGYITDKNGEAIVNVKLTVLVADDFFERGEETELVYFTDENGYYELTFGYDIDKVYRLKPTHDDFFYYIPENTKYPQIAVGDKSEQEQNFEMMSLSKNNVIGWVRANGHFLEQAKIILLKREIDNLDYPLTTDIHAISDSSGNYYIEFDNENNYEYFLKPEKNNYSIDTLYTNGLDYQKIEYFDDNNLASENISMKGN